MIPNWVLTIIEAMIPSLIVGLFMANWNRKQNAKLATQEEREKSMRKKDSLEISLLVATAELSYAVAMAIKRGAPNGEVEVAIKRYNKAMEKFRDFEREQLYFID